MLTTPPSVFTQPLLKPDCNGALWRSRPRSAKALCPLKARQVPSRRSRSPVAIAADVRWPATRNAAEVDFPMRAG